MWHAIKKYATNNIPLHWQHCSILVGRGSKYSMLVFLPSPPPVSLFHSWFAPRLLSCLQNAPTPSYFRNTTECIQTCSCAEVEWIVYFNLIVALVGVHGRGNGKLERRESRNGKRQLCSAAVTSFLLSVIRDSDGLCFKHTHTRPQSLSIPYFGHPHDVPAWRLRGLLRWFNLVV